MNLAPDPSGWAELILDNLKDLMQVCDTHKCKGYELEGQSACPTGEEAAWGRLGREISLGELIRWSPISIAQDPPWGHGDPLQDWGGCGALGAQNLPIPVTSEIGEVKLDLP